MQKIIILDFGSQTTQLIGRRVRELNTFCEILPYNKFPQDDPDVIGVILSGSPFSVYDPEAFKIELSQLQGRYPVLGICYGAQYISHTLGGRVEPAPSREYGRQHLTTIDLTNPLFAGFDQGSQVWMSHGDTITALPDGFQCIASTESVQNAAFFCPAPEVVDGESERATAESVNGKSVNGTQVEAETADGKRINGTQVDAESTSGKQVNETQVDAESASDKSLNRKSLNRKSLWGVQFHPEVFHSTQGTLLLKNFVVGICGSRQEWSAASFVDTTVAELREQIGDDRVILGLSGGVDSSVAAVLLNRAIGDRLTCIFVDHGMLRKNEFRDVLRDYECLGLNVRGVDASAKFFADLAGVTDPEQKRKIIGRDFVEVFNEEAKKIIASPLSSPEENTMDNASQDNTIPPLQSNAISPLQSNAISSQDNAISSQDNAISSQDNAIQSSPGKAVEVPSGKTLEAPSEAVRGGCRWLAQGTIYPDRIESLNITGKVIKSHHNVGGLPKEMNLQLCEPLKWLFKDEVRRVGRQLGMPEHLITRHPFPGPGLAVRILGDITPERVRILQEADDIYIRALRDYKVRLSGDEARRVLAAGVPAELTDGEVEVSLYDQVWQAGAILLATVRSVGVMGDERTYEHPVALRAVTSTDAMTADWAHLPYDFLARVSNEIINRVRGVNRVCYDVSSKPPATIEWE